MEEILDDKLDQIVKLYFEGYTVTRAIEVIRNEAIQYRDLERCNRI